MSNIISVRLKKNLIKEKYRKKPPRFETKSAWREAWDE